MKKVILKPKAQLKHFRKVVKIQYRNVSEEIALEKTKDKLPI